MFALNVFFIRFAVNILKLCETAAKRPRTVWAERGKKT